jgi:arabinogalactan endo-1,4-beta-galactosidase
MKLLSVITLLLSLSLHARCLEKIVDWSSASSLSNQKYYDVDGKEAPLEKILFNNGFTTVRQRHIVGHGIDHDHESNVKLDKRAKAVGMDVYINLQFRRGFNDPQTIQCETSWGTSKQSIGQGIYQYALGVGNSFARQDIIPKYISLGNEISHGICDMGNTSLADGVANTALFLHQASQGIRHPALGRRTKIMLHLENGWQTETFAWFFGAIEKAGLPSDAFDVIAMSAYPFYHSANATQAHFYTTIKTVQNLYKKPVLIV